MVTTLPEVGFLLDEKQYQPQQQQNVMISASMPTAIPIMPPTLQNRICDSNDFVVVKSISYQQTNNTNVET